ncbi:MAG: hypothetical protein DDT21_00416 [Syntrophomonadaceae bacterium]|nr:hypothetical protein [Bacillota bacterium]
MKRSREVIGLPVIELREGKSLGRVHGLLVNPAGRRVAALEVGERTLLKTKCELVTFDLIRSIGTDAVTLHSFTAGEEPCETTPEGFSDKKLSGSRVVTADGTLVGVVEDFTFVEASGAIAELAVTVEKAKYNLLLPVDAVENFGKDFIIVREDFRSSSKEVLPGERPAKQLVQSLEQKIIELALDREAGQDVLNEQGEVLIRKGEKVTPEVIDRAREANRLAHVLIAAGLGEVLEGLDFTREKLDAGSKKLLETLQHLRESPLWPLSRRTGEDRQGPTGELRDLWHELQGKVTRGGKELEEKIKHKIKEILQDLDQKD